jgi:hypothetical protein
VGERTIMLDQHTSNHLAGTPETLATVPVHFGAVAWIIPLRTPRGAEALSEADKPLLMHLWSFAPFKLTGDASHRQVFPSRARLARETGSEPDAVKARLRRLAKAGWIRRVGDGWDLAWMVPFTKRVPGTQVPESEACGLETPGIQVPGDRESPGIQIPPPGIQVPGHLITPEQTKELDHTKDRDHVEIAVPAPSTDDEPSTAVRSTESPPRRAGRGRMSQRSLFPDEPSKPTGPTRDPAQEVFDYLAARIVAAKIELGIKPAIGPRVLGKSERRNIDDRIREHGKNPNGSIDLDAGVTACKRVVDVDEADCVRLRSISQYWNATTPFRNAANFEGRLMRWREDGEHQVWGAKPARPSKLVGFDSRVGDGYDTWAEDGSIIPGSKRKMHEASIDFEGPDYGDHHLPPEGFGPFGPRPSQAQGER